MITTEETGISPWKTSHMRIVNIALDGSIVIKNRHIELVVINIAAAQVQFACIQIFCTAVIHATDFQHLHIPETLHPSFLIISPQAFTSPQFLSESLTAAMSCRISKTVTNTGAVILFLPRHSPHNPLFLSCHALSSGLLQGVGVFCKAIAESSLSWETIISIPKSWHRSSAVTVSGLVPFPCRMVRIPLPAISPRNIASQSHAMVGRPNTR